MVVIPLIDFYQFRQYILLNNWPTFFYFRFPWKIDLHFTYPNTLLCVTNGVVMKYGETRRSFITKQQFRVIVFIRLDV